MTVDQLIEAINVKQLTPGQREMLAWYTEYTIGINNAYCMSSKDLQALARYVFSGDCNGNQTVRAIKAWVTRERCG